jgi:hypothetical protein
MILKRIISDQTRTTLKVMESQLGKRTIFSEAERIKKKKTKLRGLIRNNLTLLNVLADDLVI